ncbi:ATP-binding protein [Acidiphilium multivorum]|uniref:ATP-binding protein n=1 Tax=Acidiphilium multivorum TaxID=62140 RepID=UPI0039C9AFDD
MNKSSELLLPEYRDNPFINRLPAQMSMREAWAFLSDPPDFSPSDRNYPAHMRVQCLYRLGRCFEPLEHHLRLEAAFSALLRQGYVNRNPLTTDYIRRLRDGHERIVARDLQAVRNPVRSSAAGFALLGASGAGKSTGVERVLEYYPQVIEHDEPFSMQQVTWLKLDCPFQGSPKQLCLSFFQQMDLILGTRFLANHGGSRSSLDLMMTQMAQIANRHALGVLIVDEIQHLTLAKGVGPAAILNFLVTLINVIGIPVVVIGTMGALEVLQGDFRQARRANGLGSDIWERLQPGQVWNHFVEFLWRYQWTREETPLTDDIRQVLYEESQGIIDVLVKLFMLGQLRVIELGVTRKRPEVMDAGLLRQVAAEHFKIIEPMMGALKSGDRRKVAKYDDLRPLEPHVQQIMNAAQLRLAPAPLPVVKTFIPRQAEPASSTLGRVDKQQGGFPRRGEM